MNGDFCKACRALLEEKKGHRKKLVGDAAGARAVHSILFEFLSEECPSTRAVSGETQITIDVPMLDRRWSNTAGNKP